MFTRRDLLLAASCIGPALTLPGPLFGAGPSRPYLEAAIAAERWLRTLEIKTDTGVTWPADPEDATSTGRTLYTYSPGIILFLLELYGATKTSRYLTTARHAADHLIKQGLPLPDEMGTGLYLGIAGIGYVYQMLFQQTRHPRYKAAADEVVRALAVRAITSGDGVRWNNSVDIVNGSAGTGLFLLQAGRRLRMPQATTLGIKAGHDLLRQSEPVGTGSDAGRRWRMDRMIKADLPNFAHGTAGVAFFLARLYEESHEQRFLDAALGGARYLQSVAECTEDACTFHYHNDLGEDLYYLGWCHGPAGTAKLFQQLAHTTGDRQWRTWADRCARGIVRSGIPQKRTPGFWNNISQCCGNAGIAEFFINRYQKTHEAQDLAFARRMVADLLDRATTVSTPAGRGLKWVQAEHRTKPELLLAQTGLMQGAAGAGLCLLHLDAIESGRRPVVALPA